jgi:hypothetical protein
MPKTQTQFFRCLLYILIWSFSILRQMWLKKKLQITKLIDEETIQPYTERIEPYVSSLKKANQIEMIRNKGFVVYNYDLD